MSGGFFDSVASLIEQARKHVGRTADLTMCVTNYIIGKMIVEQEQDGESRARYGHGIIPELSVYLTKRFGKGFSETNIRNFRKFYQIYSPSIRQIISAESDAGSIIPIQQILSAELNPFKLGWSHYQVLMRIKNEDERRFYEGEKDDAIVELTLHEGENIYASEYSLYLPDKALLQRKLAEWIQEFEYTKAIRESANGGNDLK